jgi:DNA (cytosine-5)-methyltransferase 1
MKSRDYHNEIDGYAAQWTRNLMKKGLIPDGFVDERDVRDVQPMDLWGFTRCHFFSGIAGWACALRLAGVPDDFPLWTGSCPCQSFSAAGARKGFADERHLWPFWHWLISQSHPPIVFGEQVASKGGFTWLDLVQTDLEGLGYACGAAVLPAACVEAPHERHRIWYVAYANSGRRAAWHRDISAAGHRHSATADGGDATNISDASGARLAQREVLPGVSGGAAGAPEGQDAGLRGDDLPDADREPLEWSPEPWRERRHWAVEPSMGRVADGVSARVDKLRCLGNSIVPQVAAAFIEAALACRP